VFERTIREINLQLFAEGDPPAEGEPKPGLSKPEPPAAQPFHESLAEEFRGVSALQKFNDVNGLAKSYLELERLLGYEKIPMPKADAKPEEWESVWSRLGKPQKPEEYKFESIPAEEAKKIDPKFLEMVKPLLHEANLTQKQADVVVSKFIEMDKAMMGDLQKALQAEVEEGWTSLKKDWGNAYESMKESANLALDSTKIEGVWDWAERAGVINDPMFARIMAHFGQGLSEDVLRGGGRSVTLTPKGAETEYNMLMSNKEKREAYLKGDKALVAQVTELMKQMAGDEPADLG
jgi:hypothetical protein